MENKVAGFKHRALVAVAVGVVVVVVEATGSVSSAIRIYGPNAVTLGRAHGLKLLSSATLHRDEHKSRQRTLVAL